MGADQKEVLPRGPEPRRGHRAGPYLEDSRARNLEVLFCYETVDEYVMNNVREFDGKKLTAADHADVKLSERPAAEGALGEAETKSLVAWLKENEERVADVRTSDRLVFPRPGPQRGQVLIPPQQKGSLKAVNRGRRNRPPLRVLRVSPSHAVSITELQTSSPDKAVLIAEQILDNRSISMGSQRDASGAVKRLTTGLPRVSLSGVPWRPAPGGWRRWPG